MGVLQGHGELTPDALELLLSFLESNGYDHVTVDLSAEGALTDVALLLIASPQKDFSDTELEEINEFAKEGGSLFITRDYTDPLDSSSITCPCCVATASRRCPASWWTPAPTMKIPWPSCPTWKSWT